MKIPRSVIISLCIVLCAHITNVVSANPIWRNLGPGGGGYIQTVVASPHNANEVFVGSDVGGFFHSIDGGRSYEIQNNGLADYWVECIAPHPQDPNIIYIGCQSGVHKSIDRGNSWQWLRNGFPPMDFHKLTAPISALVVDPRDTDTLYAAIGRPRLKSNGQGIIFKTTNGGQQWNRINDQDSLPADALVTDLLIDPEDNQHIYLSCQYGVYQSYNAGVYWQNTSAGLPHQYVLRIALCHDFPNVVYLTLLPTVSKPYDGGVYRSDDYGKSWVVRNEGLYPSLSLGCGYYRLVVHPQDPDIVYVGSYKIYSSVLYKTTDGGLSWRELIRSGGGYEGIDDRGWITFNGLSVTGLTISPIDPDILYFATGMHVYKTTNGGQQWNQAYTNMIPDGRFYGSGLDVTCVFNITFHPNDPMRLYFCYGDIGLLVSEDSGETFRRCVKGIEAGLMQNTCFAVVADPDDPMHCWGSFGHLESAGVIAESNDSGFSWQMIGTPDTGLPNSHHRVLLLCPDTKWLLTTTANFGVSISKDGGQTWQARNNGLPFLSDGNLVQHPTQPGVYWVSAKSQVFRTDDWGGIWYKVSQNLYAGSVKRLVVATSNPQRMYLAARDSGYSPGGVYRSDDSGITWQRVLNDNFVEGLAVDPRNADIIYAGLTDHPYHDQSTGDGVMMSRDGGKTWEFINEGLSCKSVYSIVLDPRDPSRIYLGTWGNGVFVGYVPYLEGETGFLNLLEGLNMASCPGYPVNGYVANLVAGTPVLPYIYTWNPATQTYDLVDTIQGGKCYWFAATQDTQLPIAYQPQTAMTCQVKVGWNMIGSVSGNVPASSLTSVPGGVVLPYVYTWSANTGTYELVNIMIPGGGYWVGTTANAVMTMDSTQIPGAPPAQNTVKSAEPAWKSVIAIHTRSQSQELTFGMHPSASGSFDMSLDRPCPPLPAWGSALKAGWMVDNPYFPLLTDSYVGDDAHASWELSVELSEPGELSWSHLPSGYRCVLKHDGQVLQLQDAESIYLPEGSHTLTLVLDSLASLPRRTQLLANYPNPFNPGTWLPYELAEPGSVTIRIYNSIGQLVRNLDLGYRTTGSYSSRSKAAYWDGKNEAGENVSSGLYFYAIKSGHFSAVRKLIAIR